MSCRIDRLLTLPWSGFGSVCVHFRSFAKPVHNFDRQRFNKACLKGFGWVVRGLLVGILAAFGAKMPPKFDDFGA